MPEDTALADPAADPQVVGEPLSEAEEQKLIDEELERQAAEEEKVARDLVRQRHNAEISRAPEGDGIDRVTAIKHRDQIAESGEKFGPYEAYAEVVTFRGTFGLQPGEVLEIFPLEAARIYAGARPARPGRSAGPRPFRSP